MSSKLFFLHACVHVWVWMWAHAKVHVVLYYRQYVDDAGYPALTPSKRLALVQLTEPTQNSAAYQNIWG
jgi:hypothetical protein